VCALLSLVVERARDAVAEEGSRLWVWACWGACVTQCLCVGGEGGGEIFNCNNCVVALEKRYDKKYTAERLSPPQL
jgi:hypothetical protein